MYADDASPEDFESSVAPHEVSEIVLGPSEDNVQRLFYLKNLIGEGSYSYVYKVFEYKVRPGSLQPVNERQLRCYALKIVSTVGLDEDQLALQADEMRILQLASKLAPQGVSRLRRAWYGELGAEPSSSDSSTPSCLFMQFDLEEQGDLYNWLCSTNPDIALPLRAKWFYSIMRTMVQLGSGGIGHRDLKPENVLLTQDGRVLITDFGLATTERESREFGVGSPEYMPPEAFVEDCDIAGWDQPAYSPEKCDTWALGVLFLCLFSGRSGWSSPFTDKSESYASFVAAPIEYLNERHGITDARLVSLLVNHVFVEQERRATIEQLFEEWTDAMRSWIIHEVGYGEDAWLEPVEYDAGSCDSLQAVAC